MQKIIHILLLLSFVGCGTVGSGLETKIWPPPQASTEGSFIPLKKQAGDFRFISKVKVQKADIAFFRYVCLYEDLAQTYERVGVDNYPVPIASDTMRVDCRNVLRVELQVITHLHTRHQKSRYVYFRLPIHKWIEE